jgi:hypothetical protein
MGSTICVRCGANLMPHSYCNVCHDVLCFRCSSCSVNTDERIHVYCVGIDTANNNNNNDNNNNNNNNNNGIREDTQKLMQRPIMDNRYSNTRYHIQNQLNDELKYNSINFSTSYWNNVFESVKMINRYWAKIFNIGIDNSSVA